MTVIVKLLLFLSEYTLEYTLQGYYNKLKPLKYSWLEIQLTLTKNVYKKNVYLVNFN